MGAASPIAIAIAGLGVGFVVGLTGMGGGALMTPILVLLFNVDPGTAVGSDLVASLVMKPVGGGVHLRKGTVNLRLAGWLIAGSVPSAFVSVWFLYTVIGEENLGSVVKTAIGVALLLASAGLAAKGAFSGRRIADADALAHLHVRPLPTLLIGIFGGVMVGLTSVGSGSLMMVLLLVLYPLITSRMLIGTDLVQAVPLVGAAALAHLLFGEVHLDLTGALLIGALPGVYVGAHISSRAPDHFIRPLLAVVLVVSGLKMLGVGSLAVGIVGLVMAAAAVVVTIRTREVRPTTEAEPEPAPEPEPFLPD